MEESLGENCGVASVSLSEESKQKSVYWLYKLLLNMQNRGQLSAGISTYNSARQQLIDTYKAIGLVNEVFKSGSVQGKELIDRYSGSLGIGHVRYATCGSDDLCLAQPFERHHGRLWKWFTFCFNGNLANFLELKSSLLNKEGYHVVHNSDTEIMMHYIAWELRLEARPDIVTVFSNLSEVFDGAYNIAFMDATGQTVVVRDPLGIRPMSYGKIDGEIFAASESNALANCGINKPVNLKPGQMLLLHNGSSEVHTYAKSQRKAHCMFEWVYFSNCSSTIDGVSVYSVRRNLGKNLAKTEPLKISEDTVIVPVPETSNPIGDSMAYELGTSTQEGLMRNRFIGRTFIDSKNREDTVRNKFTVLREVVEGKKVILVDDSIVRGTTIKRIIGYIKEVGKAKEVHMRVACPPIMAPCFYGIDMSTLKELLAPGYYKGDVEQELPEATLARMAKDIGADSLLYQTHKGLVDSIGIPKQDICMACLNHDYPTQCGRKLYLEALEKFGSHSEAKRAYE